MDDSNQEFDEEEFLRLLGDGDVADNGAGSGANVKPAEETAHQLQPNAHQIQPNAHQIQQVAHQVESSAHQIQPVAHQTQPTTHQIQPSAHQVEPVAHQVEPVAHQIQPISYQIRPTAHQIQPISHQVQPVAHQVQPTAHQIQQTAHQIQPTVHQIQPTAHQVQPIAHQVQPDFHQIQLAAHQVHPAAQNSFIPDTVTELLALQSENSKLNQKNQQKSDHVRNRAKMIQKTKDYHQSIEYYHYNQLAENYDLEHQEKAFKERLAACQGVSVSRIENILAYSIFTPPRSSAQPQAPPTLDETLQMEFEEAIKKYRNWYINNRRRLQLEDIMEIDFSRYLFNQKGEKVVPQLKKNVGTDARFHLFHTKKGWAQEKQKMEWKKACIAVRAWQKQQVQLGLIRIMD